MRGDDVFHPGLNGQPIRCLGINPDVKKIRQDALRWSALRLRIEYAFGDRQHR
jgi:hypothetical protein